MGQAQGIPLRLEGGNALKAGALPKSPSHWNGHFPSAESVASKGELWTDARSSKRPREDQPDKDKPASRDTERRIRRARTKRTENDVKGAKKVSKPLKPGLY